MNEFKKLRKRIDHQDRIIMKNLDKRFFYVEQIGQYKNNQNLEVQDNKRENEIINKTSSFKHDDAIIKIYKTIFQEAKHLQAKYYLVLGDGRYSYSSSFHEQLGNKNYAIYETKELLPFLMNKHPLGLNISNPLKLEAFKYCQNISAAAKATGVVNLMTLNGDGYDGDNTDCEAFLKMLKYHDINVKDLNAIIIGNGATAKSIAYSLNKEAIKSITYLVRTKRNENEILISEMPFNLSCDLLINTAAYDIYPDFKDEALIDIDKILNVKTFIDVNYNPFRSKLYLDCEKRNIKCYNGLMMLIYNALISEAIWQKREILDVFAKRMYQKILKSKNLVLIGQTLVGKSTIGNVLKKLLHLPFFDTDQIIFKEQNFDLKDKKELEAFRIKETNVIKNVALANSSIIAIGAGAILKQENIDYLKRNGILIFLDAELDVLLERLNNNERPLLNNRDDLIKMYESRQHKYIDNCDFRVSITKNDSISAIIDKILEQINENINY